MKRLGWLCLMLASVALAACGDDEGNGASGDAGPTRDGSTHDDDAAVADAGNDAATDASTDSGTSTDAGSGVEFEVPAAGGTVELEAGAATLSFKFPSSAAGESIVLTVKDPSDVTLPDSALEGAFGLVIGMAPDGATFDPPVEVSFSDGSLIAFNLSGGVLEPLPLSSDGTSLLVSHFSDLMVPLPTELCESEMPWTDYADSQRCSAPTSTSRQYTCKNYRFCYVVAATCCVDPSVSSDADDGCLLGSEGLALAFQRTGSNGGQYPYCDDGLPKATSVSPTSVADDGADKTITLNGSDFSPNGSVVINFVPIATTYVSATQVTAVIPAVTISGQSAVAVAYVNPRWNAAGPCHATTPANCDLNNPSAAQTITVTSTGGGGCLSGGAQTSVSGQGTCAMPLVVDLRNGYSGDVFQHVISQAQGGDEANLPSSAQCGLSSTPRDVVYQVRLPAGADLDVGVDGPAGVDPAIFVHEDSSCGQPINDCANDTGAGGCEVVSATHGNGEIFGTAPFVTVAEVTNSGSYMTARFRLTGTIATPSVQSISPTSAVQGSADTITVTLGNHSGWAATAVVETTAGVFQEFASCTAATTNTCTFALPNSLSPGDYHVKIQFQGRTGMPFATGMATLTVTGAGGSCLSGGTAVTGIGQGSCAMPFIVDLRNGYAGDVFTYTIPQSTGADEANEPSGTYCGVASTARDFVYQVLLPAGADLEIGTDATAGSDPSIFVHEDSSCGQPINACADDEAANGCEHVAVTHGTGQIFGQGPYITVSEETDTGTAIPTRFRLTGAIATPSVFSINPTSATSGSNQMITVTLQNGSMWNAYAVIETTGGVFQEMAFCDPTSNNTCDFSLPNSLSAGSYHVKIQFQDRTAMPFASGMATLTVN